MKQALTSLGAGSSEPPSGSESLLCSPDANSCEPPTSQTGPALSAHGPPMTLWPPRGQPRSRLRGCCVQTALRLSPSLPLGRVLSATWEPPQYCCCSRVCTQVLIPQPPPTLASGIPTGATAEMPLGQGPLKIKFCL